MTNGVVIIGGSVAGYQVAINLRKEGYEGKILIISEQETLPYDPKVLSKSWMMNPELIEPPSFATQDFYDESKIDLMLKTRVAAIDPSSKTIHTEANASLPYDKLVLATGSILKTLNVPGSDAKGLFYLRNFEQALAIKEGTKKAQEIVIVGAGFIGLEMASSLSQLGLKVTVIEFDKFPLARILGEEVSRYFIKMHESRGVTLITGEGVTSFEKDNQGQVIAAHTSSGKVVPCQMVIVGIGVSPNTSLTHPNLQVDRGYLVNEYGETTLADVFAVGDCVMWPYLGTLIHVEHWEHAFYHGQTVAKNIVHPKSSPYVQRPYFWTDQYDQTFEYLGHATKWHKQLIRGNLENRQFVVAYVDENNYPIAVLFANKLEKRKNIAKLMDSNRPIDEGDFVDVNHLLNE